MHTSRLGRTQAWALLFATVLAMSGCGSGGGSGGGTATHPLSGQALKGPFAIGSQISVNEQNASLSPTGKVYNVQTTDSLGNFSVASGVGTNLVEIVGNGFYVDDLTGLLSSAAIQLDGIADLNVNTSPTVNVLTSLQEPRLKTLISQGLTYAAAYAQSQSEVLSIFGIDAKKVNSLSTLYSMKFDGKTDADSVLVAASVVLSQMATDAATANGTTQPAELSNYINTAAAQIAGTGTVTGSTFATARNLAEAEIKLSAVRSSLETYYAKNGLTIVVPKFEEWVDQSGSGILPQRLVAVTGLAFTDVAAASPGQLITSNVATIAGLGTGVVAPVAVSAGTTIIRNNTAVTGIYSEVQDGDTVAMRVTAPGYDITNPPSTISVGSSSAVWRVTSAPLGGTISGLSASGLVLQVNGANNISVPAGSTSFSFPVAIANGTSYNVSVLTQPISQFQICSVSNASGMVGAAPSNINLACESPSELALVADLLGVSAFAVSPTTGALTQIAGSPFAGTGPVSMTIAPNNRAYVVGGDKTIWTYTIDPMTGALSGVGNPAYGNFTVPHIPVAIAFSPSGFEYDADGGPGAQNGAIEDSPNPEVVFGQDPTSITVDPSGKFLYVAAGGNYIFSYTIAPTTGALTPITGSPFASGGAAYSVTVHPSGKFLYLASGAFNNLSAYGIDLTTGALTPIAGSPFPAGTAPSSIAVHPSGKFLYVANSASGDISAYTVEPTTGALTPTAGSPFAAAAAPNSIAVDLSGKFVYVANSASGNISAYTVEPTTGALTPIAGYPFATGSTPLFIAVTHIP